MYNAGWGGDGCWTWPGQVSLKLLHRAAWVLALEGCTPGLLCGVCAVGLTDTRVPFL
eukprot:NODE_7358_length_322_cov_86.062271_g6621_i0.p2 GENE.NODE_7358_length_322_cov_86.062271_g6621_i0~~NODE_7358_length_322_cov_86.062271_g6621_i0.p2  ORF type:complete len:57 (+),score=8.19 NODE_7358_length_322_cov_86.062271_g6621_i0:63-233(+)